MLTSELGGLWHALPFGLCLCPANHFLVFAIGFLLIVRCASRNKESKSDPLARLSFCLCPSVTLTGERQHDIVGQSGKAFRVDRGSPT
jgi:hypothetical protein